MGEIVNPWVRTRRELKKEPQETAPKTIMIDGEPATIIICDKTRDNYDLYVVRLRNDRLHVATREDNNDGGGKMSILKHERDYFHDRPTLNVKQLDSIGAVVARLGGSPLEVIEDLEPDELPTQPIAMPGASDAVGS